MFLTFYPDVIWLEHSPKTNKCTSIFRSYCLILTTYQGFLSLNPRNVAAQAVNPPLILIYMKGGGGGHSSRLISAFLTPFLKINEHAEHVNGKQTLTVIKALLVTFECGLARRWEDALSARPLERCPQLLGPIIVVVCLFIYLCGFVHTHTHTCIRYEKTLRYFTVYTLFRFRFDASGEVYLTASHY